MKFPWNPPSSVYNNDGPNEDMEFEIGDVALKVKITEAIAVNTWRHRYEVTCVTCDEILHEATTGASVYLRRHLKKVHGH